MSGATRRGPEVEPREIMQESDAELRVTWADGRECRYGAPQLRRLCPCAQCVNEFTGERVLKAEAVPEDLRIGDVNVVGRYALTFHWSDGHDTGIYSFRYLREICEGE
ncbi:MAG: hypothetical protein QOH51_2747 [Acidobacteriota bacterium]|jgi:DUF971 family protein|nr:hypothetical protein [Acidobacteriota bacterium]